MNQYTQQTVSTLQSFRASMYDVMTSADYKPLIVYKSQFTGYTKIALPSSVYLGKKDRYIDLKLMIRQQGGTEDLSEGEILFGTKNFPFGFYDVTIYENNNDTNMDIANTIKVIYNGLLNVSSATGTVDYTEYTTNDSDTESVYITI